VVVLTGDGRNYRQYVPTDGLTHEVAIGVGEDREGGLWVTTQNGINRIDRANNATLFDDRDGLGDGILFDLVRQDGVLYAAYNETLMKLVPTTATARAHWEKDDRLPAG